jgi:hypothetical protein
MHKYLHWPLDFNKNPFSKPSFYRRLRYIGIRMRRLRYQRKSSFPFISGDAIAHLTDYIAYGFSKNEDLNFRMLINARSVFIPGEMLSRFLVESEGFVKAEILVTGNSDYNFNESVKLPSSIKLWICQNNGINSMPELLTLPIGIENLRLGRVSLKMYRRQKRNDAIANKVFIPPMSPSNPIRYDIVLNARKMPEIFDIQTNVLPLKKYFSRMRKYHFIFCAEGNGFDTHRLWEVLYQGSFPVVLESKWSLSLKTFNLPIFYIKSLSELNVDSLRRFLVLNQSFNPIDTEILWLPYWRALISSARNR